MSLAAIFVDSIRFGSFFPVGSDTKQVDNRNMTSWPFCVIQRRRGGMK